MTTRRTLLIGGLLAAVGITMTLFVLYGGNTPPGQVIVAATQKYVPAPAPAASAMASPQVRGSPAPSRVSAPIARNGPATSHAPLPPQNVPLAPYFEDLKRRADAGEPAAACRLSFEIARCEMRPGLRQMVSRLDQQTKVDGRSAAVQAEFGRQLTELQGHITSLDATCKDLPGVNPEDLWRYALLAAQSGNVKAMVQFAAFPPGLSNNNMIGQLDGWLAWRANAGDFIQRAVEAGDPGAMDLAAYSHMHPRWGYQVLPLDPVRGVAHYYALQEFANPAYRRLLQRGIESSAQEFNLTPAQLAQAQTIGAELATKMARAGQAAESVDFRKGSGNVKDAAHCE